MLLSDASNGFSEEGEVELTCPLIAKVVLFFFLFFPVGEYYIVHRF